MKKGKNKISKQVDISKAINKIYWTANPQWILLFWAIVCRIDKDKVTGELQV